jgi:hypothetical protein
MSAEDIETKRSRLCPMVSLRQDAAYDLTSVLIAIRTVVAHIFNVLK